jgi:hypothetical protein
VAAAAIDFLVSQGTLMGCIIFALSNKGFERMPLFRI